MSIPYDPSAPDLVPPLPLLAPSARVFVAYSGGLDSTVLLHALATLRVPGLIAVHVHHGLQPTADQWVEHCARCCAGLGVPLNLCRAQIAPDDPAGPEAAAREARYRLLREELRAGDLLVTAHHRDDQAETVLLRLLRGSGVHGMAAMRALGIFAPGRLWRPFLDHPRVLLQRYAEAHQLTWIDDPHNRDPRYARSWLREELLPTLRARWPQTDTSLARGARLAAETVELLDALAEQDAQATAAETGLKVSALLALSHARRHNLLRHWLRSAGSEVPAAAMFDRSDDELLSAARDAAPLIHWAGCELRRYRDALLAMPPLEALPDEPAAQLWREGATLALPAGCGLLRASAAPPQPLLVRRALVGESFRRGSGGRQRSLKNLFQEAGLPPWLRTRVPLIELNGRPACIAGVAASEEWQRMREQTGWQLQWQHGFSGLGSPLAL
ncbi:MAG: tRNA lysidine(34) synthetase TilS [Nevskia sp.]